MAAAVPVWAAAPAWAAALAWAEVLVLAVLARPLDLTPSLLPVKGRGRSLCGLGLGETRAPAGAQHRYSGGGATAEHLGRSYYKNAPPAGGSRDIDMKP